jgi:hypothetical protein
MGLHRSFGHLKHKWWPKERPGVESNWQFDSWPQKVRNQPDSLMCKRRARYRWKALDQGYNFALNLIAIGGLHKTLCALKITRVSIMKISGLPLGSLGTKNHLDVAPVERRIVYYKGEGGGFPQVWAMVSLVCSSCPWLILAPKVLQLCINHFVLVLCKSVWVIKACHFFLVPSRSSIMPLYPSIVLRARERAPTPCSFAIFNLRLTFESLKELGVRQQVCLKLSCKLFLKPSVTLQVKLECEKNEKLPQVHFRTALIQFLKKIVFHLLMTYFKNIK